MAENAAVALSHRLWPLLVDPENQALRWVQGRAMARKVALLEAAEKKKKSATNGDDNEEISGRRRKKNSSVSESDEATAVIGSAEIVVLRQTDTNYIPKLLRAAADGAVTLIEDVSADSGIDAALQPLLDKTYLGDGELDDDASSSDDDDGNESKEEEAHQQTMPLTRMPFAPRANNKSAAAGSPPRRHHRRLLALNDKQVTVHPAFSLFLRSPTAAPKFQPEVFSRTAVIDFSVTEQGLQELLLSTVVAKERPELEAARAALVASTSEMTIALLQCEDVLLEQLSAADGDILQNETLVQTLEGAKQRSIDVTIALKEADVTRVQLAAALSLYSPIAARGALAYMCLAELGKVDDMYRYSIDAFSDQFVRAIGKAQELCNAMAIGGNSSNVNGAPNNSSNNNNAVGTQKSLTPTPPSFPRGTAAPNNSANKKPTALTADESSDTSAAITRQQQQRIDVLVIGVTKGIYAFASRSLFSRHRIVLAAALAFSIGLRNGSIPRKYMDFLIRCPRRSNGPMPHAAKEWLSEQQWEAMTALADIEGPIVPFSQLMEECLETMRWRVWCDRPTPETERLPGDWKQLSGIEKLMLIRVLRNDRMISATRSYIIETMGRFLFDDYEIPLADVVAETPNTSPILFVLSPGADPSRAVSLAAAKHGISELGGALVSISMGQGQETSAERAVTDAATKGSWVVLHNVHLMRTWIAKLDRLVGALTRDPTIKIHPKFRLFMSADPIDYFPPALLQASTKLVDEPPAGLKANFTRAYALFSHEPWEQSTKPQEFHALVYTMCYFHAAAVERSKFGPAGWNRRYPFNFEDLLACTDVLAAYLEDRPRIPWEDLQYVFGQIMYGGHITDPRDSRLCMAYLQRLISPDLIDGAAAGAGGEIVSAGPSASVPLPVSRSHAETMAMIRSEALLDEGPRMFFMNPLSENRARATESTQMFGYLLDVMPKRHASSSEEEKGNSITKRAEENGENEEGDEGGGGSTAAGPLGEDIVALRQTDMIAMLLGAVPEHIHIADVPDRLGPDMTPYQHVFLQECERLNNLSSLMRASLDEADGALKGTLTMTHDIELFLAALELDTVPPKWLARWGSDTRRPLASWMALIGDANSQLSSWAMDFMTPKAVNLQCFFAPIAFLTAIQQEAALRLGAELDQLGLVVEVTKKHPSQIDLHARDGCFVYGPSLEGAVWDPNANCLSEVTNKDGTPMPVMIIRCAHLSKIDRSDCYACPLYGTTARFQTFIATLHLKTRVPSSEWVLRGTALILDGSH